MNLQDSKPTSSKRGPWIIGLVAIAVVVAGALVYVGQAGSEALFSNSLAFVLAMFGLVGTIFLSLWGYRRNREAHNAAALQHDFALQEIARILTWHFKLGYDYDTPTGGHIAGWGWVDGTLDGLHFRIGAETYSPAEGASRYETVVIVKPPIECGFSTGTTRGLKFTRKRGKLVCREAPELSLEELEPLVVRAVVSRAQLAVTLAPPAKYFNSMSYELATQTDVSTLREAIAACAIVAKRLLV